MKMQRRVLRCRNSAGVPRLYFRPACCLSSSLVSAVSICVCGFFMDCRLLRLYRKQRDMVTHLCEDEPSDWPKNVTVAPRRTTAALVPSLIWLRQSQGRPLWVSCSSSSNSNSSNCCGNCCGNWTSESDFVSFFSRCQIIKITDKN